MIARPRITDRKKDFTNPRGYIIMSPESRHFSENQTEAEARRMRYGRRKPTRKKEKRREHQLDPDLGDYIRLILCRLIGFLLVDAALPLYGRAILQERFLWLAPASLAFVIGLMMVLRSFFHAGSVETMEYRNDEIRESICSAGDRRISVMKALCWLLCLAGLAALGACIAWGILRVAPALEAGTQAASLPGVPLFIVAVLFTAGVWMIVGGAHRLWMIRDCLK